jgi:NADH:ubiquinone oxidoreductase subunit E
LAAPEEGESRMEEMDQREKERLFGEIQNVIDEYKDKDGALIMVLHKAQEIYGYLPLEVQEFISTGMDIPLSEISGVVSFYSFFSTKKRGRHIIRMCQGTACYVRGGKKIVDEIKHYLNVEVGDTTEDGKFTFEIVRCIGACGLAPAMMVDDDVYKQVSVRKLPGILAQYE